MESLLSVLYKRPESLFKQIINRFVMKRTDIIRLEIFVALSAAASGGGGGGAHCWIILSSLHR